MLNKVILIGNVGNDPEAGTLPDGRDVTNLSVATSHRWKDKATGEQKEETTWHDISFYSGLAQIAASYALKGRQIYVEGRIQKKKYTDKDGIERYRVDIVGSELRLLGPRPSSDAQPKSSAPAPAAATDGLPQDGDAF